MAGWVAAILRCEERRRVKTDFPRRRVPTCIPVPRPARESGQAESDLCAPATQPRVG